MKNKIFSALFGIVFAIQLYGIYETDQSFAIFSKPLIVITLLAWLFASTNLKGRFTKQIFIGLVFALLGDILLMYVDVSDRFFIYGLVAFLMCHIFYIRAFSLDHKSNPDHKNPYFLWAVGAFSVFCTGLFFYLQPYLGGLQFPVLLNAIIISVMAIMAVNRYGKVNILSFKLIVIGALFFLLSDAVLAVNKFVQPIPESRALVMASYMIAQFLIVYGTVTRKLVVTRTEI
ncbi:lysoplasmalogenase [Pedobacter changchengzhani]|uniref:Lysoplasmalogenase n=1 Tax=Pedobacter changchengzhani TaxID=2529274 RepID=A0A4R5MK71_9SPHI|nr:lysoplasmalogenase [Pedobacter changchengzhani]TDG36054.1 lysoplasmalogenase [Pedobacter changchengzhani]